MFDKFGNCTNFKVYCKGFGVVVGVSVLYSCYSKTVDAQTMLVFNLWAAVTTAARIVYLYRLNTVHC